MLIGGIVNTYLKSLGVNTEAIFSINGHPLKIGQIVTHYSQSVPWLKTQYQLEELLKTEINSKYIGNGILEFTAFTIHSMGVPNDGYGIYRISAGKHNYIGQSQNEKDQYSSGRYGRSIAGRWTVEFLEAALGKTVVIQGAHVPANIEEPPSDNNRIAITHDENHFSFDILELVPAENLIRTDGNFFSQEIVKSYLDYKESYFMGVYNAFDPSDGLNQYEPNLKETSWEMGSKNAGRLLNVVNYRRVKEMKLPYATSRFLQKQIFGAYRRLIDHRNLENSEIDAMVNDIMYLEETNDSIRATTDHQLADTYSVSQDININWAKSNQEFAILIGALSNRDAGDSTRKNGKSFKRIEDVAFNKKESTWNHDLLDVILSNMSKENISLFYETYPSAMSHKEINQDISH